MPSAGQRSRQPADVAPTELSWNAGWASRRWLAAATACAILGFRFALVMGLTWVGARNLSPHNWLQVVVAWVGLSLIGVVLLVLTERATRQFLPIVALLRLGVAFPDVAPSRYRTALKAGSTRSLRRTRRRLRLPESELAPAEAAACLLELVGALGVHDGATRGHCERVRAYTELLAEELGLPRAQRHQLRWGGLVHDVGKVRIPKAVLNKRSALGEDDWELIRRHPLDGLELAAPLRPWLGDAILAVSDHHERWEGGGYPTGVAGTEIALSGRIVAVADAFDVMTSARSYKQPISAEAARQELAACAGRQFDPDVVRAFLTIPMPRLRRILGPLASMQAAVQLQWRFSRYERTRQVTAAVLMVGITYAGGAFAMAAEPPVAAPHMPSRSDSTSPGGGSANLAAQPRTQQPRQDAGPLASTGRGNPVRPTHVDAPSHHPTPVAEPTKPVPHASKAPSPPASPGIIIDPSNGTVTIIPPGTVPVDVPPLVSVPIVGTVACGDLHVCQPIVIHVPPLF